MIDGDFEWIAAAQDKDAWIARGAKYNRVTRSQSGLPPPSGGKFAILLGESDEKARIYQMINIENLAEAVDDGLVSLAASVSASPLSESVGEMKLSVLCWDVDDRGKGRVIKKTSRAIPLKPGDWNKARVDLERLPPMSRWLEFRFELKGSRGLKGEIAAVDEAVLILDRIAGE